MDSLPITVVIVAKNAERTIEECLKCVQRNVPAEIILVDGNSRDRTLEIAGKYTKLIYTDEGRGISYARQLGAERATQEYVAYVDSDITLADGALPTMLDVLQHSEYVWVNALLGPDMKCSSYWEWARYQHDLLSQLHGVHKEYLSTMAGIARRDTVLKYGWDIHESHMDDTDLEIRLRADGHRFGNSAARFHKCHKDDLKNMARHRFLYGVVAVRYLRRYGLRHIRFWPPLTDVYWMGFCLVRGKFKLIPYFVIDAIMQALGMIDGLFRPGLKSLRQEGE